MPLGFNTDGSCEGHKNYGCNYPWIDFCCYKNLNIDIERNVKNRLIIEKYLSNFYHRNPKLFTQSRGIYKAFRLKGNNLNHIIDMKYFSLYIMNKLNI